MMWLLVYALQTGRMGTDPGRNAWSKKLMSSCRCQMSRRLTYDNTRILP